VAAVAFGLVAEGTADGAWVVGADVAHGAVGELEVFEVIEAG
jgi:hypothetical protein